MKRIEPLTTPLTEKRLLSMKEFQTYCGLGKNRAIQLAKDSNSRIKYGKRVLIDRMKFDRWCEANSN